MKKPKFKKGDLVFTVNEEYTGVVEKVTANDLHIKMLTTYWFPNDVDLEKKTVVARGVDADGDIYAVAVHTFIVNKEYVARIDPSVIAVKQFDKQLKELLS
jgi:hypothetical protein